MYDRLQFSSATLNCPLSNCYVHLEDLDCLHSCQHVVGHSKQWEKNNRMKQVLLPEVSDIVGVIGYNASVHTPI